MKIKLIVHTILWSASLAAQAQIAREVAKALTNSTPAIAPAAETAHAVVDRGPHQKVWAKVTWETDLATGVPTALTNSYYTELATGMGHLVNGTWTDAS